jgi:hypothetical protein
MRARGGSVPAMHVTTLRDAAIAGADARSPGERIPQCSWPPNKAAATAGRGVYIMVGVRTSTGARAADARNPRVAEESACAAAICSSESSMKVS